MKRKIQLDGLRGIAILMVFFYHALRVPLAWSGVDLFFVLSGYLITGILLRLKAASDARRSSWNVFYVGRACRILPPVVVFLFLVTIVYHLRWAHLWYWYVFFGANLANILAITPLQAMVPLWSLAVEEQFYFVWPWVVRFAHPRTLKKVAIVLIIAAPLLRAACTPFLTRDAIYYFGLFRVDGLAWGSLIALLERENAAWVHLTRRLAGLCAVAAAVVLCALSALHTFRQSANTVLFNTLGYSLLGVVFAGVVVYVLGSESGFVHAISATRLLRYVGQISYTIYLYHLGVLNIIQKHFHGALVACALSFAVTGAIAALSWTFYESPILRWYRGTEAIVTSSRKAAGIIRSF